MKPLRERMISLKREGRKLLGCFPLYPPLALFHAMALEPVVMWGFKPFSPNTPKADRHVQNYVCSVGGHLVESVLSDACSLLDAIIVPTELLKGFDVVVCAPESHSAMSSARKVGALQCEKAEGLGYSTDLCSYARIQNRGWCCYGLDLRYKALSAMIERFSIDGIVFASNRSCKVYSVMQMDLMKLLMREHGIPAVMIDVDHADPRKYSAAKAFIQLEALLENIEAGRSTK
ncbi:MAG: 2-hydroxyacyl-CoA dehydratase [Deltaproteobacteria bacterium]|nr:2-hydroxyacyl-CoA dehydratase [Deltaproteobacteria bacterium]MBW1950968.1 2-hydroxyacyl-CoA dehydratase [Deltaproteobacteria bacterium]MBW2009196.1 2-hydroxyacyl-CoA dehydratase [Deltaproteobacteria bacterium]MBW2348648.1 2-hydroxyacyl-CoA dehydratase [Deltaproteobacteria bacterium]RLB36183.1 MAG: hypothetical protein DRH20_10265 [Deltaproteobacteria bacterium]